VCAAPDFEVSGGSDGTVVATASTGCDPWADSSVDGVPACLAVDRTTPADQPAEVAMSVELPTFSLVPETAALDPTDPSAEQTTPQRPKAFEYSDAYMTRRKIHVWASYTTLPLFGAEILLGSKLWDEPDNSGIRDGHRFVATAIAGLFGVNTVTGVWNLWEGWKDPNHRALRLTHSFLMLGADAGFVWTGTLAPSLEHGGGDRNLHRTVALTSIGVASASYLMMLFAH